MPYKDPERRRENDRKRTQDPEYRKKRREYGRTYQQQNREKRLEYQRARRRRNPDRERARHMLENHGMRPEEWAALYEAQHGRCYLCGEELTPEDAVLDHDHVHCAPNRSCQICRRGLAHARCNIAIGHVYDDPGMLRRMADALEAAQLEVEHRKATTGAIEQLSLIE